MGAEGTTGRVPVQQLGARWIIAEYDESTRCWQSRNVRPPPQHRRSALWTLPAKPVSARTLRELAKMGVRTYRTYERAALAAKALYAESRHGASSRQSPTRPTASPAPSRYVATEVKRARRPRRAPGRPPESPDGSRSVTLRVRLTPSEISSLRAQAGGRDMSDYVRQCLFGQVSKRELSTAKRLADLERAVSSARQVLEALK
jgi:hypothetical protein